MLAGCDSWESWARPQRSAERTCCKRQMCAGKKSAHLAQNRQAYQLLRKRHRVLVMKALSSMCPTERAAVDRSRHASRVGAFMTRPIIAAKSCGVRADSRMGSACSFHACELCRCRTGMLCARDDYGETSVTRAHCQKMEASDAATCLNWPLFNNVWPS